LPAIVAESPEYDRVPWRFFGRALEQTGSTNYPLVDIGANIGDSIAHFRCYSSAEAWAFEPSHAFIDALQTNAQRLGSVRIVEALVVPRDEGGEFRLAEGSTTAHVSQDPSCPPYTGLVVTVDDLISLVGKRFVVKSDTDGMDPAIVRAFLRCREEQALDVPIFMFEGATEGQLRSGEFRDVIEALTDLIRAGYLISVFSNRGPLLLEATSELSRLEDLHFSLSRSFSEDRAFCHYFDFLAVQGIGPS
jgi:FkbM family methyltransferase